MIFRRRFIELQWKFSPFLHKQNQNSQNAHDQTHFSFHFRFIFSSSFFVLVSSEYLDINFDSIQCFLHIHRFWVHSVLFVVVVSSLHSAKRHDESTSLRILVELSCCYGTHGHKTQEVVCVKSEKRMFCCLKIPRNVEVVVCDAIPFFTHIGCVWVCMRQLHAIRCCYPHTHTYARHANTHAAPLWRTLRYGRRLLFHATRCFRVHGRWCFEIFIRTRHLMVWAVCPMHAISNAIQNIGWSRGFWVDGVAIPIEWN